MLVRLERYEKTDCKNRFSLSQFQVKSKLFSSVALAHILEFCALVKVSERETKNALFCCCVVYNPRQNWSSRNSQSNGSYFA